MTMANYESFITKGPAPEWPYPILYDKQSEINADVLVIGGGIAGCTAAIAAAKKGVKVALVEKSATVRAGAGGSGIDHWLFAATNPVSEISPEEMTNTIVNEGQGGWMTGITLYIQSKESYDALLDLERWGMKVRDSDDEFKGAPFRDEKSKLLFCYDYKSKNTIRIWGVDMKPVLYRECKRLGVDIYDRVMATSLLNEGGRQGGRVVGATGMNVHTGEFTVFKARATILCTCRPTRLWHFDSEHVGLMADDAPPTNTGDGWAMAWKAGAELAMIEKSTPGSTNPSPGVDFHNTGGWMASWHPATLIDSAGKTIPYVNANMEYVPPELRSFPVNIPGQKFFLNPGMVSRGPGVDIRKYGMPEPIVMKMGKEGDAARRQFIPPYFTDLPSMTEHERNVIFGLMIGNEGRTNVGYRNLIQAGFDPEKDMPFNPWSGGGRFGSPNVRSIMGGAGGVFPDWDLRSTLEGLYAASHTSMNAGGAAGAAATGRYAGRKAAEYAKTASESSINRKQAEAEKKRIYAPVKRNSGMDWKELNGGIARVMQDFCGDVKTENMLKLGLTWFKEIREAEAATAYARNPHELMHIIECLNMIDTGEAIMHASLARKSSNPWLSFERWDYPEQNPPEWRKWLTVKLEDGEVRVTERPLDYWGDIASLKENYAAHCSL
jgi:succinate dehydrogenase/fumarate reductase flavoprotein subunit